jgi:hypothetical protein
MLMLRAPAWQLKPIWNALPCIAPWSKFPIWDNESMRGNCGIGF